MDIFDTLTAPETGDIFDQLTKKKKPDSSLPWYERAYESAKSGEYKDALQTTETAAAQGVRRAFNLPVDRVPTWDELKETGTNAIDAPLGPGNSQPLVSSEDISRALKAVGEIGATSPEDLQESPTQRAIRETLAQNVSGLTSPNFAASLPAYELRAVRGAAALGAAPSAYSEATEAIKAYQSGDEAGAAGHGTQGVISALMAAALAKSTLPGKAIPESVPQVEPRATTTPETAKPLETPDLTPQEPATGTVRLYHGSASGMNQAGRDFTTSHQYASDYAAKASEDGGKVWYVDVPEGAVKTHDEYGQPMSRVVVPDEIADQARPFESSVEQNVPQGTKIIPPEGSEAPQPMIEGPHVISSAIETPEGLHTGDKFNTPHAEIITDNAKRDVDVTDGETGFYVQDENGVKRFASRDEAAGIAREAGQLAPEARETKSLQSQDLRKIATVKFTDRPQAARPAAVPLEPVQRGALVQEPLKTGISAANFEKTYGEGEIPVGESMSPEEIFRQGQRDLASGKDPYALADRARKGEVTPRELGLLAAEHRRLVTEAAAREGTPEYEGAYVRARDFAQNMLKPAGTRWHQIGVGLQVEAPIDYGNLTGFRRAVNDRLNREMKPEEAPQFKTMARDVAKFRDEANRADIEGVEKVKRRFSKVKDVAFDEAFKQIHERITDAVKDCNL